MGKATGLKQMPRLETDEDAERFVDEADLSEYDLSLFRRMKIELAKKGAAGEAAGATAGQDGQDSSNR
jgi:CopG antitoxin of type II toxin-antitoxin system